MAPAAARLPAVTTILEDFECEMAIPPRDRWQAECKGHHWVGWIRQHLDQVPSETVSSLLDGLERLALTTDVQVVRQSAVAELAAFGTQASYIPDPMPGILPRLLRIYRSTDDMFTRSSILVDLRWMVERAEAVAFLTEVAQQDSTNEDFEGAAESAVRSLGLAGPLGASALRSLDEQGLVKDRDASGLLRAYSRHGYQHRSSSDGAR